MRLNDRRPYNNIILYTPPNPPPPVVSQDITRTKQYRILFLQNVERRRQIWITLRSYKSVCQIISAIKCTQCKRPRREKRTETDANKMYHKLYTIINVPR